MLLPRYSVRTILLASTGCVLFFVVLGQAVHGQPWAIVVSVAVISLLATLIIHALLFLITVALTSLVGSQQLPARTSRGGVQASVEQPSAPAPDDTLANN